jgi:hypothetical protein
VSGQLHSSATSPRGKNIRYPLNRLDPRACRVVEAYGFPECRYLRGSNSDMAPANGTLMGLTAVPACTLIIHLLNNGPKSERLCAARADESERRTHVYWPDNDSFHVKRQPCMAKSIWRLSSVHPVGNEFELHVRGFGSLPECRLYRLRYFTVFAVASWHCRDNDLKLTKAVCDLAK